MKRLIVLAAVAAALAASASASGTSVTHRPDCPCGTMLVREDGQWLVGREYVSATHATINVASDNPIRIVQTARGYQITVSYTTAHPHTRVAVDVATRPTTGVQAP